MTLHPAKNERPTRALFLNDTARNGGPGRSLHTILTHLDPRKVTRIVLLPREDLISELLRSSQCTEAILVNPDLIENVFQPALRPIEREDLSAPIALRAARLTVNLARATRLLPSLMRTVRDHHINVIYCNGTSADFVGGLLAVATGVPAIWHARYTSVPRALVGLHRYLAQRPEVSRIICVSNATRGLFSHVGDKARVIHNAVDLSRFYRGSTPGELFGSRVPADSFVFGSSGRILPRKGYLHMVRAARIMLDQCTEPERQRARFVVAGDTPEDSPEDHLAECRALVKSSGLDGIFHFTGFCHDVRMQLEHTHVVVLPSVYPDPLPRTVIEAMAYGHPVIGFDVGGVGEMLRHGLTGTLLPNSASPEALAGAMLSYLRDPEKVAREGEAARREALQAFDAGAHGKAIEREILAAHRTRPERAQE